MMRERTREQQGYYVSTQDWPVGADDDDLSPEQIRDTLADLDGYFSAAMKSLKTTPAPASPRKTEGSKDR